ncbi:MAG TPA: ATP-binding protein [Gaiellaceae bacterium]|nr:ATP-binding protein [Gaiellaceae bacterium]
MEGVGQLVEPMHVLRRFFGRQVWLLAAFTALLIGLIGAFAYLVVHSENESRSQARQQFAQEAQLTAQFTGSLLATSAGSGAAAAAKEFGGATVDSHVLDATVKAGGLSYLVILDGQGHRIAASTGAPATAATGVHVRHAVAGKAWFSDLIGKQGTIEWAEPFQAASGDKRIEVEGFPALLFTGFLNSFLASAQTGNSSGGAFILDTNNRVVATSSSKLKVGSFPKSAGLVAALRTRSEGVYRYSGVERYFASADISASQWRAVSATTTASIYPPLAGTQSWVLFAALGAFAFISLMSIFFFRRALVTGDELQQTNTDLEERVAERTADAEERARELARSNQELEQFSSIASHDLQEPLRKIRMFGERLRESLDGSLPEEAASDLERMHNAAERMQTLINDLLEFSRVSYRGRPFEPINLSDVAAEVVSDLEGRITELDGTVDVAQLPVIDADRSQIRQLLQNLIANALKFHKPGEAPVVRVSAEVISGQTPRFEGEAVGGDRVVITVEDNGIGFETKHADRIFGAFERLHGRSEYEGTGIGLSIARKIAWRHGGHITATSAPNEGSVFTVTLPLSPVSNRNGGSQ